MTDLVNCLLSLRTLVGEEEFRVAVQTVLNGAEGAAAPGKGKRGRPAKKEKKEKKTREPTEWNRFVKTVWDEMKLTADKVKYSEAMSEAKRRREATASASSDGVSLAAGAAALDADESAPLLPSLPPPPPPQYEDQRRRVFQYLFDLQESGVTNMLGASPYLVKDLGLNHTDADEYLDEYISDYDELKAKYGSAAPEPAAAPAPAPAHAKKGKKAAAGGGK